jgi:hypothetical protein
VLLRNLREGTETIDGCTLSHPKQKTIAIEWNGQKHEYVYGNDCQNLWYGGYPGGSTFMLRNYSPANTMGVDGQRFRVATKEDLANYRTAYEEAEGTQKRQIESRSSIRKLLDWAMEKNPEIIYPARPEETPPLILCRH